MEATKSPSAISANSSSNNSPNKPSLDVNTVYGNVMFRGKPGKLRLTSEKITFKPDDWEDGRYDSWRWTAILKHQISPNKALLKLISKTDPNQSVLFQLASLTALDTVRNDITHRLRVSKTHQRRRRSSTETTSAGEFYAARRGSDLSFSTVSTTFVNKDALNDSYSSMNNSWVEMEDGSKTGTSSRRVSALGMEDPSSEAVKNATSTTTSPTKGLVLLDPSSDAEKEPKKYVNDKKDKGNVKKEDNSNAVEEFQRLKFKKANRKRNSKLATTNETTAQTTTRNVSTTKTSRVTEAPMATPDIHMGARLLQLVAMGLLLVLAYDALMVQGGGSSSWKKMDCHPNQRMDEYEEAVDCSTLVVDQSHSAPFVKIDF